MNHLDAVELLRLQVAWGADEALADEPLDRLANNVTLIVPNIAAVVPPTVLTTGSAVVRAAALAAAATTLAELEQALRQPGISSLADTASHLLFGTGPSSPSVMLIADTPGDDDDRAGGPFAGEAGAMLDRMFGSIGLTREHVRITYLVPWRPPGGRPLAEPEIALGAAFLRRHVDLAAPRHLVVLGALAARALLGREAARRRAGPQAWKSFHSSDTTRRFPTLMMPHPATVRRNTADRRAAWDALRLLRRALDAQPT